MSYGLVFRRVKGAATPHFLESPRYKGVVNDGWRCPAVEEDSPTSPPVYDGASLWVSAPTAVHTVLGTVVGETLGYLLTATRTVLIIYALGQRLAGRWFTYLGLLAAGLIALGVLVPLDVPGTDFANFAGYILWSIWLVVFATLVWRRSQVGGSATEQLAT